MIILLILVLGGIAAGLIAWIIRQRSAETGDPGPPADPTDDPMAPIVDPTESVALAEAPVTPEVAGDEATVAADPFADPALDLTEPPADQPTVSEGPQTTPIVGGDDPTSSFRTGPGA